MADSPLLVEHQGSVETDIRSSFFPTLSAQIVLPENIFDLPPQTATKEVADRHVTEEILEAIWVARENECDLIDTVKGLAGATHVNDEVLGQLKRERLVSVTDGRIELTWSGEIKAKSIVRKKRLAERLMVDVLGMHIDTISKTACEFEHVLSQGVEETICTLLGHPNKCPHGTDIPEGVCCQELRMEVENIITTLNNVRIGREVRIVYIHADRHTVLHKLTSYGIVPGTLISVLQKSPALVVQTQNLQLALDRDIGEMITVRKL
ncbi:MAG: metal-dependent transcriptional regulator [Candidatus Latescibacteria bacterium]|jgi:DtxR family transcriptional regulator, Mn-dependent transcriptional regulator|nr:metal-dependent transcriptional regulator [Candidatus Latescibacterota bacterium]